MSDFALEFIPGGEAAKKEKPKGQTNLVEQGMSGVNTGLGKALGFPVDTLTGALNLGIGGVNKVLGSDIGEIENPVGGSGTMLSLLDPTISDVDPQTAGQRYARRAGEEVGFGVPVALATAGTGGAIGQAARSQLPAYMAANAASDVGAGVAGQAAQDIAPNNPTLEFIASLLGGSATAAGINKMATRKPKIQTRDELAARTNDAYSKVKNSGADLTPAAQQRLNDNLTARFSSEGGDPLAYPKANAQLNVIEKNPRQSVYGVEQARRRITNKVARTADEGPIGQDLVAELDDYLKGLGPADVSSNTVDPQAVVGDLTNARRLAHQGIKADEVADALRKGETRASTAGTGGNELNAKSQEVRKIYDKEASIRNSNKSGGYTPDEVAAMERIVYPSRTERALQRVGRWSPGTGALQSQTAVAGGGGGITAALATGNPVFALGAAPAAAGVAAQTGAEMLKKKRINELLATILNEGATPKAQANKATQAAIVSQLLNSPQ